MHFIYILYSYFLLSNHSSWFLNLLIFGLDPDWIEVQWGPRMHILIGNLDRGIQAGRNWPQIKENLKKMASLLY